VPTRLPARIPFLSVAALAALALGPAAARAQTVPSPAVELDQLHGSPFFDRTLRLDGTGVLSPGKLSLGVDADYALRPLVVKDEAGATIPLVRDAVGAELRLAIGLLDRRLEAGVLLPVTAYQAGDTPARVDPPTTAGLEAARVGLKVRLLGDAARGPSLGAAALAVIPTGSSGGLVREHGLGGEGRLFGGFRGGALTLAAGAGVRLRHATALYDVALGNELLAYAAADLALDARTRLFAELSAATALAHPWSSSKQSPLELLVGGKRRVGALQLFGAVGPGLADGYGTPVVRVVAGGAWSNEPPEGVRDRDGDGIPDDADRCPDAPEDRDGFEDSDGCPDPDNDNDGIPDVRDKCPNEPETKNGWKDDDGCPDKNLHVIDTDGDGIMDDVDKCPTEPEDKDGFQDDDGCPDPDNDKDGIPDVRDKCPNEPETINNVDDDDGCPDKGLVTLKEGELETLAPIFFKTDRARVRHAFRPPLDDIAAILIAHPEIGRCAVEGHTDATGPEEWNKKLSLARAEAVVKYLVGKGVDPTRVVAIGQGQALPWASNQTEAGRAANRRVIFHIEGVSEEQEKKELEVQRQRALKATGATEAPAQPTVKPEPSAPAQPPASPPPSQPAAPPGPREAPLYGPPAPATR
jgi:outer membrane protein OmpA-like peptidoglycan-associated protein